MLSHLITAGLLYLAYRINEPELVTAAAIFAVSGNIGLLRSTTWRTK